VEKQAAQIRKWADENGHQVVRIVADPDTSGAKPIRVRPEIGRWLTEADLIASWDILVGAKLDRAWRSTFDFLGTVEWARPLGKTCVVLDLPGADFRTPDGELQGTIQAGVAQYERRRIGQRRAESGAIIRQSGRWDGGRYQAGYMPLKVVGGYRLVQDPEYAPLVRQMVTDAIKGVSILQIVQRLNDEGVPTPADAQRVRAGKPSRGALWRDNGVRRILTSPGLLGQATQMRGSVITALRDGQGKPVMLADGPLITEAEWHALQAALATRRRHRGEPQATHLLYRVAYCRKCSAPFDKKSPRANDVILYGHRRVKDPAKGSYYACGQCGNYVPLERLEQEVTAFVLLDAGERLLRERKIIPGDDHAADIARLERRAERLRAELAEEHDPDLARSVATYETRIAELRAMPHQPEQVTWVPAASGVTVAAHWDGLDSAGKGRFLRDWGVVVFADRDGWIGRAGWLPTDKDTFNLPDGLD
jgi:site-specific DNA recombinase